MPLASDSATWPQAPVMPSRATIAPMMSVGVMARRPSFPSARSTPNAAKIATTNATDRKSTRLNSSHLVISYAVFCLKKKKTDLLRVDTSRDDVVLVHHVVPIVVTHARAPR